MFWDGYYVSQLPYVWYYVVVNRNFKHAHEEYAHKSGFTISATDKFWVDNTTGMRVLEGLCVFGAWCLVCQDPVSCYFCFVLLPLELELW